MSAGLGVLLTAMCRQQGLADSILGCKSGTWVLSQHSLAVSPGRVGEKGWSFPFSVPQSPLLYTERLENNGV